ncbi:hypothetical protein GCM10009850_068670 [Nonomuraea monospora]|uniref:Uncharacterized protein n=1 Tax=Nonomuraea monospora TaxID=568818 RepID=A0ABN3CPV4_9ACTN
MRPAETRSIASEACRGAAECYIAKIPPPRPRQSGNRDGGRTDVRRARAVPSNANDAALTSCSDARRRRDWPPTPQNIAVRDQALMPSAHPSGVVEAASIGPAGPPDLQLTRASASEERDGQPWRAAIGVTALLTLGTLYFSTVQCNATLPRTEGLCPVEPDEHPAWDPFLYTLDLLIPLVSLGHDTAGTLSARQKPSPWRSRTRAGCSPPRSPPQHAPSAARKASNGSEES